MSNYNGKIAVIGAGPVGISAARALKLRGIDYDQFESASAVGGNWRHGVYCTAHIISSRKTTEFPDLPMPAYFPDFPAASQMLEYLEMYARHYELEQHISFNTEVTRVSPRADQLWDVILNGTETRIYEGVVICNGHHWDRKWPLYPGSFSGQIIHSKDYKSPDQLRGQRVLVIGGGNSACDIACEAARSSSAAHLSLRRGYWFMPKTIYGKPTAELLNTSMPVWMQRVYLGMLLKIIVGDYRQYGLQVPDHKLFDHHPTINTELLHYLKHGRIEAHSDVEAYDGDTVRFVDGSSAVVDLIVCGTGFKVSIPFLDPGVIQIDGPVVRAHWGLIAPRHKQLYVYGWGQARYGFGPLLTPASELLADLILMQRRLEYPLGTLLEVLRQPLPQTHLIDPMAVLRQVNSARMVLPLLPLVEKYLVKK